MPLERVLQVPAAAAGSSDRGNIDPGAGHIAGHHFLFRTP